MSRAKHPSLLQRWSAGCHVVTCLASASSTSANPPDKLGGLTVGMRMVATASFPTLQMLLSQHPYDPSDPYASLLSGSPSEGT